MKVSNEVRNLYFDYSQIYSELAEKVKTLITAKINERWHYEGRIKSLESYATKLETGRHKPKIEDFFACTLVVENLQSRKIAEDLILSEFKLHERRPRQDKFTHKNPDSFPFDDIRLYVSWIDTIGSKPTSFTDIVFEVQIKTFLQHAWSIATHDMIYKTSEKNWAKERIAFQIKAMLEHAEISILEADSLSRSISLDKNNKETEHITKIIDVIKSRWSKESLPSDVTRLADNVSCLLKCLNLSTKDLIEIIDKESSAGRGCLTINLSPFGSILQGVMYQKKDLIISYMTGQESKYKFFLTKDFDIPPEVNILTCTNVITPTNNKSGKS